MNIQHSMRNDSWATPAEIIERARAVLGSIDLDPASCDWANGRVRAAKYYTEYDNGLEQPWFGRVFLNPPGGKVGNKSKTGLFWRKLMESVPDIKGAVFMGFSLECLQTTQKYAAKSVLDFPICVPSTRIRFVTPNGPGDAPSHSNVIAYVPGSEDRTEAFFRAFRDLGACR
jgi:ParB family chromosome partitioning protein